MIKKAIKAALPYTIPVLAGYIFLGIAFGLLMKTKGFPTWYPIIMSIVIYSGALEFAAIPLLTAGFDPFGTFILGLMISFRHLFYGIPMLSKYEGAGKLKLPLIFTLTDESFSINTVVIAPSDVNPHYFYSAISFINYGYWVVGTAMGAVAGNIISFNTAGIDFALTALFIVLFLEQVKSKDGLISGLIGLGATAIVLAVFGGENMVVISMVLILIALFAGKKVLNGGK